MVRIRQSITRGLALLFLPLPLLAQTTIHVPADKATIQTAIAAANTGDTVLVSPGTYNEHLDFLGKNITVTSEAGPTTTIIDGGGYAPAVIFQSHETRAAILSGFTIRNGGESAAVGYYVPDGGVGILSASPSILNNIISGNTAHGLRVEFGAPLVQGNTISGTTRGSGKAQGAGAGIYLHADGPNCFSSNPSDSVCTEIAANLIQNNGSNGGFSGSGAIAIDASDNVYIERNIIRYNLGPAGTITLFNTDAIHILGNLIYGNAGTAALSMQAPYFTVGPFTGVIVGNTFYKNGLQNLADTSSTGSEIAISYNVGLFVVVNNIVVANSPAPAVACTAPVAGTTPTSFDHNIIVNLGSTNIVGPDCDIPGTGYGNIFTDPLFVNPGAGDFHLQSGSPAIDAGNSSTPDALSLDVENNPRFSDATGLSYPIVDIGAYEKTHGVTSGRQTTIRLVPSAYIQTSSVIQFNALMQGSNGIPTGTLDLYLDNAYLRSATIVNGTAMFDASNIPVGRHTVYAKYAGVPNFSPAVSVKFYIQINTAISTASTMSALVSSLNPSIQGQAVTFTATVTTPAVNGAPTGSVMFADGATTLATIPLSLNNGGVNAGVLSAYASYSTSVLAVGSHNITASYQPTQNFGTSAAALTQVVVGISATSTTLTSSQNPSIITQTLTYTAHITSSGGIPTGTVTFTDGATALGTQAVDASGNSAVTSTPSGVGPHNIAATYVATGAFSGSQATLTQQVNAIPTTAILSAAPSTISYGASTLLTVNVTAPGFAGLSSGTVTFCYTTVVLGQPVCTGTVIASVGLSGGQASFRLASPSPGTYTIGCLFATSSPYAGTSCNVINVTISASQTSLTLGSSANPSPALLPVTFTAKLTGVGVASNPPIAASQVTFTVDGVPTGATSTDVNGVATIAIALPGGTHTVAATFAATLNYLGSSSQLIEVMTPYSTTTTLSGNPNPALPGQTVTLQVTVIAAGGGSSPVGTITILDGATAIVSSPTPAASPSNTVQMSFAVSTIVSGTHSLTAVFSPNSSYTGSVSAPLPLLVLSQDFSLTAPTHTVTLQTQHHGSTDLTLTSIANFSGAISLSCVGQLPPVVTCTLPGPVNLDANATATATLALETDALANYAGNQRSSRPGEYLALAFVPLALLGLSRRRRSAKLALAAVFALLATTVLNGCSGKIPDHTPPGTYSITVQATGSIAGASRSSVKTATIQLIVTP